MHKVARSLLLLVLAAAGAVAQQPSREPEVAWATEEGQWDGWKGDVVRMRAARKVEPVVGALHSETVQWDRFHDSQGFKLLDGRALAVNCNDAVRGQIDGWEKGRMLLLCYSDKTGAYLLDPSTSLKVPLGQITAPHPITGYIKSLNANTTYEMMSASYEERRLWSLEIDRIVRAVLDQKHLPADVRREFVELTRDRVDYCRRQSRMGAIAANAAYPGGTIAGPAAGAYSCEVYRTVYYHLASISQDLLGFSSPPKPEEPR